jgi:hypothetical protein
MAPHNNPSLLYLSVTSHGSGPGSADKLSFVFSRPAR